ncbi:Uma2 family endonuclease [Fervidibacter sacchari]|uniref:Uma2 family endonuclease n=1 Tax=Candidatus Fervidibacter sacchari TaxID=1448929 RepID=A0ABT2EPW0_9BACT|nr:Uma2 family endonuclease [Candidatus Fervidibacter sacchari]MCS3920003.1 Uma2 family endonuclease [Candidatus Fervidibacter sacchari]WKU16763.1 Uma2 family endonuclease [Candidatus Fervidibacter sacchari]
MGRSVALAETREERTLLLPLNLRPLTFDEFVRMFGEDDDVELVDGMVVQRVAARDIHEDLQGWLLSILRVYSEAKGLGIVRGSRTAVKITEHRGRLPDIVFVRKENASIVQEEGIIGTPDLIVEIWSPGDRPSDMLAKEADYRSIGVPEIWFIDQQRKQVRVLKKGREGYEEKVMRKGILKSEVVEGFWLNVKWLFKRPLPHELKTLQRLLGVRKLF